ncbi:hypothetical protein [Roseovarius salinarum]|uniref:hypothetical protein n=1 Tax=Roseovarius salinarum TaxID=1981892 RepID=UPI000C33270B|nr:hypothetical protein [Roseovarius salinarum]
MSVDAMGETAPRHARLFELIRQRDEAERIASRTADRPAPDPQDLRAFARQAARSFDARPRETAR